MFRRLAGRILAKIGLAALLIGCGPTLAFAQEGCASCTTSTPSCSTCTTGRCQWLCCPPALKWCMEGAPRICFHCGCPKPICSPCEAPNWGYYQKCWTPWPWPPDWSHCPVPPPASQVYPGMIPAGQGAPPDDMLPAPRPLSNRPPL
jgi:hypothetical protein